MSDDTYLTEQFDSFLTNIADNTAEEKLFLTAGLVELLRHTKSHKTGLALAELLVSVPETEWNRIPFSITKTLLSDTYKKLVTKHGVPNEMVAEVLLSALLAFLDRMQEQPPTEAVLSEIVSDISKELGASLQPEVPAKKVSAGAPPAEIFNHWLLKRVFTPVVVTDDTLKKLGALLVYFSAPLSPQTRGPEVRGLAFDNGTDRYFTLLESGELVVVPKDYEHLRIVNCDVLHANMPSALFLSLCVTAKQLEMYAVISKEQLQFIEDGNLGKISQTHFIGVADANDLAALEHVFDIGREAATIGVTGATGPVGASVRFPVPGTDLTVVLDANQDAHGPYSTSRLVRENETGTEVVMMRQEAPRLYALRGVYLFPLKDKLISLTTMFKF